MLREVDAQVELAEERVVIVRLAEGDRLVPGSRSMRPIVTSPRAGASARA